MKLDGRYLPSDLYVEPTDYYFDWLSGRSSGSYQISCKSVWPIILILFDWKLIFLSNLSVSLLIHQIKCISLKFFVIYMHFRVNQFVLYKLNKLKNTLTRNLLYFGQLTCIHFISLEANTSTQYSLGFTTCTRSLTN